MGGARRRPVEAQPMDVDDASQPRGICDTGTQTLT